MSKSIWRMGASCNLTNDMAEKIFAECKRCGIAAVEMSIKYNMQGMEYVKEVFSGIDFEKIKRLSRQSGVELWSYHLPFDHAEVNPASLDGEVRRRTVELDKQMIAAASDMGMKMVVLHASGEPIDDRDRAESMKCAKESIFLLSEEAKKDGITLAVENLPRTCLGKDSAEILELIAADDAIGVCFDVNHLLTESHKDFVNAVGSRISTLHISDYDFVDERHWVPGRGKIDWNELVMLLSDIGYEGPFMNEVNIVLEGEKTEQNVSFSELKKANDIILCR
ncbi:MAG: sugar phosphate isomerase/epimerase [Clostridia bacterium]|nr:sugar phosphate isomerase/epimerase [Clostridia bacterium]